MGMFDSFWMKAECPYCGNAEVFEFQTKSLMNCMVSWKQGERFDKFKKKIRKFAWCPDIKDGVIHNCTSGCNSDKCRAWEKKNRGYNSGFGRSFDGDIVIKNGKVHKVINIRKLRRGD